MKTEKRRNPSRWLARAGAAAPAILALFAGSPAQAQGEAPPARAAEGSWGYALWTDLMSPFCPGRTLADCTSGEAEQLRTWILVQAAAGRSQEEVEAELLQRFGDRILSAPRAEGIGLTAYLLPALAFAAGGTGVALFLARQTRRARLQSPRPELPAGSGGADAELERIVDAELERLDSR